MSVVTGRRLTTAVRAASTRNRLYLLAALVFGIAAFVAVAPHGPAGYFPDSSSYRHLSFVGHSERLWTVPLIYQFGYSDHGRELEQTMLSVVAWCALGWQLSLGLTERRWRALALSLLAVVALSDNVTAWNITILSESVAISLTVLLIAAWFRFTRRPDNVGIVAVLAVSTLWIFTRQAHAFVAPLLVLPWLVLAWRSPSRRRYLLAGCAAALTTALGIGTAIATSGPITRFNDTSIIALRSGVATYMESHGMPTVEGVPARQFDDTSPLLSDEALQTWIRHRWNREYATWLFKHPGRSLVAPVTRSLTLATTDPKYARPTRVLPAAVQAGVNSSVLLGALALLGIAGTAVATFRRRPSAFVLYGAILLVGAWWILVYNLAATELARLADPIGVALRVVAVAGLCIGVDCLRPRRESLAGQAHATLGAAA